MNAIATLLSGPQRSTLLDPLLKMGWRMGDATKGSTRDAITKDYKFKDFADTFEFMTRIALKAESRNHHPEWFNVYNCLTITWSTHDCSGLSQNDIDMASYCDQTFTNFAE